MSRQPRVAQGVALPSMGGFELVPRRAVASSVSLAAESPRLLDEVHAPPRLRHCSPRSREAYAGWIGQYIPLHKRRQPRVMAAREVTAHLNHLAVCRTVGASTQKPTLGALTFLFGEVLDVDPAGLDDLVGAKAPRCLPVVLSRDGVVAVLGRMMGALRLMATLLDSSGRRVLERCRARTKAVDFTRHQITVRGGRGGKDRKTVRSPAVNDDLEAYLKCTRGQHRRNLGGDAGWPESPGALGTKLPGASREWSWQWVCPATRAYPDQETQHRRRHHLHDAVVQMTVRRAVLAPGVPRSAACHAFCHSIAANFLEDGGGMPTVQAWLGQKDVATTMVCTYVLNRGPVGGNSRRIGCSEDDHAVRTSGPSSRSRWRISSTGRVRCTGLRSLPDAGAVAAADRRVRRTAAEERG